METIARFFKFDECDTDFRRESLGGVTSFMTMAYIVAVNPSILSEALGRDLFGELVFATCVSAAIATLLMGVLANYPFALAPGMGLNAFFTYGVVLGMGVHWELALGVVLASGLLFVLLTVIRVREVIITAVPDPLKRATAAGIGMFIAFIGLKNAGLVVADEATLLSLGDVRTGPVGLVLLGILGTGVMLVRGVNGAILLGVLGVTALSMLLGVSPWPNGLVSLPVFPVHLFGVAITNLPVAFHPGLIELVFAFLFVDLFDTMGTLVGLSERVGFLKKDGQLPRANKALLADSVGSVCGGILGTSTVTTYIESASGISAGARTGFANVVTGALFLVALFFTPLIQAIPTFATSSALVMVGVMMMLPVININWEDVSDALPAFLTLIAIPFTFSISDGLALGFISYPIVKRLGGKGDSVHVLVDVLAVIFIAKYLFM
ncbi:MAG: NCS2 family permease [Candidatus Latescibacteria bacterium]|jgi:adenine/guanine/hypoxanthine permease|nr:NCS2 family permease [Candidatus Latescibacterota bacterium]